MITRQRIRHITGSSAGRPKSHRAVGSACGANPAALVVPCHRVVRADGSTGGYRWGEERKQSLLDAESTQTSGHPPRTGPSLSQTPITSGLSTNGPKGVAATSVSNGRTVRALRTLDDVAAL